MWDLENLFTHDVFGWISLHQWPERISISLQRPEKQELGNEVYPLLREATGEV